jgi:hypothetical protein
MPQLKIINGYSESPIIPALFIIAFSLLSLSGCASMMQIPEGPAQATLAVEKGRVLISHGDVYETAQDGMILEPDVRVILLEGAKAKVNYAVEQEGEETAFTCEVELEENSQLIVNGAQDCVNGEIVANNINVSSTEEAAAEFPKEQELAETAVVASVEEPDNSMESEATPVVENNPESVSPPAVADNARPSAGVRPVAAVTDRKAVEPSVSRDTKPAVGSPKVASAATAATTPSPAETTHSTATATADRPVSRPPAPDNRIAMTDNAGARPTVPANTTPLVRKTVVSTKTIELPEINMQSIVAVTKASNIPLVLQSLPQRVPGIKYIDAVIMPDNS